MMIFGADCVGFRGRRLLAQHVEVPQLPPARDERNLELMVNFGKFLISEFGACDKYLCLDLSDSI